MITRARSVLTLDQDAASRKGDIVFRSEDYRPAVQLPPEMWRDMGNPEDITISVWPGDRPDVMGTDLEDHLRTFHSYPSPPQNCDRTIASLEPKVRDKSIPARLRTQFAQDTVHLIDSAWKQGHIPRKQRRQAKRALVG